MNLRSGLIFLRGSSARWRLISVPHSVARFAASQDQVETAVAVEIDGFEVVRLLLVRGIDVVCGERAVAVVLIPADEFGTEGRSGHVEIAVVLVGEAPGGRTFLWTRLRKCSAS